MTKNEMFEKGLLRPGQEVQIVNMPDTKATIIDSRTVNYRGEYMTFTRWVQHLTGWKGVNLFKKVELSNGQLLGAIRKSYLESRV